MLTLTDDLRIGHPEIDADHERLIEIINAFCAHSKLQDNARLMHETLKMLLAYCNEHFEREEAVQRACQFPYAEKHAQEHRNLVAQVTQMARIYFLDKSKPLDAVAISELNEFMGDWLMQHIKRYDLGIRDWLVPPLEGVIRFDCKELAVLIIDDDAATRAAMCHLLRSMGTAHILTAADGHLGLKMVFGDPVPDLIVCAADMTPIDGLPILAALRASNRPYITKIPLVLLSGGHDEGLPQRASDMGAAAVIAKNTQPGDMSRLLSKLMMPVKA